MQKLDQKLDFLIDLLLDHRQKKQLINSARTISEFNDNINEKRRFYIDRLLQKHFK